MSYKACETRYNSMPYRRCGKSGLMLPTVSLGLWHNFGGLYPLEGSREMCRRAFDLGITHFDLANNYGPPPGSAEETFGQVLKKDLGPYRDELVISTKAGYRMWSGPYGEWGSRKNLLASLDQSLRRMGLEYVDIFYSHRPDPDTPLEETMSALDAAVRQGKALYVGVSSYKPEAMREAVSILKSLGTPCLIHQPKYSMINRWVEEGLLEVLAEEGIGCIAYSSLAQGLLSSRYLTGLPEDSRAAKPEGFLTREAVTPAMVEKAKKLNEIAAVRGQSLAQMALSWVLKDPRMTSVIIGASRAEQIEENVKAAENVEFSADELAAIDRVLGE